MSGRAKLSVTSSANLYVCRATLTVYESNAFTPQELSEPGLCDREASERSKEVFSISSGYILAKT